MLRRGLPAVVLVAGALVVAAPTASVAADTDWRVVPVEDSLTGPAVPVVSFTASGGARQTADLLIANDGDRQFDVVVTALSLRSDNGTLRYDKPAGLNDASTWLDVQLPPRGSWPVPTKDMGAKGLTRIPIVATVPNTARTGEHYAGLRVTRTDLGEVRDVPVLVQISGQFRPELEFSSLQVRRHGSILPFRPDRTDVAYTLRNNGNVAVHGLFRVQFDTLFNRKMTLGATDREVWLPPGAEVRGELGGQVWPTFQMRPEAIVERQVLNADGSRRPQVVAAYGEVSTVVPVVELGLLLALVPAGGGLWWRRWRRTLAALPGASATQTKKFPLSWNFRLPGSDLPVRDRPAVTRGDG